MTWRCRLPGLFVLIALPAVGAEPATPAPAKVSYYKDIRPIFQQHCQGCHQPAKAQGNYIMTEYADLFDPGNTAKKPIVKGEPEASHLMKQITAQEGKRPAMPKDKDPLPPFQVEKIRRWIAEGA